MTELIFTTKDVANMLRVDKSTVKRWTDEGKLKCFRTPGGHRKFRAEDLSQFMAEYNYAVSPTDFSPRYSSDESIIRGMIAHKEFNVLDSVCFSGAIKGSKDELVKLFSEAYRNGMTLPAIFDEIFRPTIKKISNLQQSGKLQAAEKQLALTTLANSVVLLSDVVTRRAPNGIKAICAMVENDLDDLELKALIILLESQGAEVLNLGAGCPADSVAQLAQIKQPHFVFLLASAPQQGNDFAIEHQTIFGSLKTYGGKLIVGGAGYTSELLAHAIAGVYDLYCSTFKEFAGVHFAKVNMKKGEM